MCRSRCKRNRKGRGGAADLTLRRTDATVAEAVSRTSDELYAEACRVIPGGVNSPVRSWTAVGGKPLFIQRARGAEVVDADGHAYLDFVGSWGPLLLGHAHPAVIAAIAERARHGTSFGAPTVGEVQLARLLVEALPSLEQVRLVSSGTEATMSALRLARATTGRDLIVKFAGCYHGHVDALLVRAGSGVLTLGVPDSPGVPAALAALTLSAEFNHTEATRELLRARGGELAAVIVEPVAGNMGVVAPAPGFLEMLREETSRAGSLLIFDEVITGFRVAWSSWRRRGPCTRRVRSRGTRWRSRRGGPLSRSFASSLRPMTASIASAHVPRNCSDRRSPPAGSPAA